MNRPNKMVDAVKKPARIPLGRPREGVGREAPAHLNWNLNMPQARNHEQIRPSRILSTWRRI